MFRMRLKSVARILCLLATALMFIPLAGCGDDEGDILSPSISSNADNAFFTTSDSATLKVDVEPDATIEVAVGDGLTLTTPVFEGTSVVGDTWSFDVNSLVPGANAVAVTAVDTAGNQQTLFMTVTYDFVSIDRLVTPLDQSVTSTFYLAGTVADTVSSDAMLTLDVSPTPVNAVPAPTLVLTPNRWGATLDLAGEIDGSYTVTITADDGTTSHSVSSLYTLDSVSGVPQVDFTALPPTDIAGTRSSDAAVVVQLNTVDQDVDTTSGLNTEWRVDDVTLSPGKNFIKATVTDGAGLSATAFDSIWN